MSDVLTAIKMSNDPSGASGGQAAAVDAEQSAADMEAGKTRQTSVSGWT
jgi:hypothetical protein